MQITDYITAPYQGVSQAPPQVRDKAQASVLDDVWVGIPQGAIKRPPFSYQARLAGHPGHTRGLFEMISRELDTDVFLTITNEAGDVVPRLYEMESLPAPYDAAGYAGETITIQAEAQAYLDTGSPDPLLDLRVLTVEDTTFIVNRKVTVLPVVAVAPARDFEGMLWVRQSNYARTYKVIVTPTVGAPATVELKTPSGATTASNEFIDTDVIAQALIDGTYTLTRGASISGSLDTLLADGFSISRIGGVIYISHPTDNFAMEVEDGQGGVALIAIKDKVQRFSDLPLKSVGGFTVRITQQTGAEEDDFFVQYVETAGTGTGVWEETIAPGASLGLDPELMPVILFFDGAWNITVADWKPRTTGDELLSPDPDFVGSPIQDLTFYRGRLAVVSGEGVTLSATDDPFRLYPKTLSSVLDSDPIGFISPYPGKNSLRYGIPFEKRLLVFGDVAQLEIGGDGILSASNASVDVITTYEFSRLLRPQSSNGNLYFVAARGKTSSTVYEMDVERVSDTTKADDMTNQIPSYLPSALDRVANCPIHYSVHYATSGDSFIYCHLFRYVDGQRVQNAFSRWSLPEGFQMGGLFCRDTEIWMLAVKDGAAHCVMSDTSPELLDDDPTARIMTHLDFRLTEDQVLLAYSALTDRTIVTLPFDRITSIKVTSRAPGGNAGPTLSEAGPGPAPEGFLADVRLDLSEAEGDNEVVLTGDWTACPLWAGLTYVQMWKLSRLYAFGADNLPLRSGRLNINRIIADYADTGYLKASVKVGGRNVYSTVFEGYRWDDPESIYNRSPSDTYFFSFPVRGRNEKTEITFSNDTHFQSKVLGFEWRGELVQKAQRIG